MTRDGRVAYRLQRPWRRGETHRVMAGLVHVTRSVLHAAPMQVLGSATHRGTRAFIAGGALAFLASCGPEGSAPPETDVGTAREAVTAGSVAATLLSDSSIFGADVLETPNADHSGAQSPKLYAATTGSHGPVRTLLKFSTPAIPAGNVVVDASLSLSIYKSQGTGSYSIFALTRDWNEGGGAAIDPSWFKITDPNMGKGTRVLAAPGNVTWRYARYDTDPTKAVLWTTPGGDTAAAATATVSLPASGTATISGLQGDVQRWVSGATNNYGWIVVDAATSQSGLVFQSSEGAPAPTLTVKYCPAVTSECQASVSYDAATGNCAYQNKPDNTACTADASECTNDVCVAGACTHPAKADNTACTADASECTSDVCLAGACQHPNKTDNTACTADASECTNDVCLTGTCQHPAKSDGTACSADTNSCTNDVCVAGACTVGPTTPCTTPGDCQASPGTCTPSTGKCSYGIATQGTACSTTSVPHGMCTVSGSSATCTATTSPPSLYAWGDNTSTELAVGSTAAVVGFPTVVPTSVATLAVAGGDAFTVAVDATGAAYTWGDNSYGQLGTGSTVASSAVPVSLSNIGPYVSVVGAGRYHGLLATAWGAVYSWGDNSRGQLGRTGGGQGSAAAVVSGVPPAIALAGGRLHSVVLTGAGEVWTWGHNDYGELGDGTQTRRTTPVKAAMPVRARAIAAGDYFTLALGVDGNVYSWGDNSKGQLLLGVVGPVLTPTTTHLGATQIAAGGQHAHALVASGGIYSWGSNSRGELGLGFLSDHETAAQLVTNSPTGATVLTKVIGIAAGLKHAGALLDDGTVWTWGDNTYGQLGDTTRTNPDPVANVATVPYAGLRAVAATPYTTLALKGFGRIWTWGSNQYARLGTGKTQAELPSSATPVLIASVSGMPLFKAFSASCGHQLALGTDGTIWGWGDNSSGQLNLSSTTASRVGGIGGVVSVAAGCGFSAAVTSNGAVWAWGNGAHGALGNGGTANNRIPTRVTAGAAMGNVVAVSAKGGHVLALNSAGRLFAWGQNDSGQTGRTPGTDTLAPVGVVPPGDNTILPRAVFAGLSQSYAVMGDGRVIAWGGNTNGELGRETTSGPQYLPDFAHVLANVSAVSGGSGYAVANEGGGPLGWGNGSAGQYAIAGTLTPTFTFGYPVFTDQAAGWGTTYARSLFGTLYATGSGSNGALGTGSTSTAYGWTAIVQPDHVWQVAAGQDFGMALTP